MATSAPGLPSRFPIWTKAIYSFSGESKRDLGFIEGDLIEALNAGDGQWWTGRLYRNRQIGVFPSNFVQILPDSFRPMNRASSPLPSRASSPLPQKQKSKAFRKPFTAYAAPDEGLIKREEARQRDSLSTPVSTIPSPAPRGGYNSVSRQSSLQQQDHISRGPSPAPSTHNYLGSRAPSPAPVNDYGYDYRAPSPAPPMHSQQPFRAVSPAPPAHNHYASRAVSPAPSFNYHSNEQHFEPGSSPPPPPPPHRHLQSQSHNVSHTGYHTPRATSPRPLTPQETGLTPSPLRTAMDDVMSSLADMSVTRDTQSPEQPLNPWSPEAFDQSYINPKRTAPLRANTSLAISRPSGFDDDDGDEPVVGQSYLRSGIDNGPPELSNYVERMERRLSKMHKAKSQTPDSEIEYPPAVPPKATLYDRPKSSMGSNEPQGPKLRHRKSAYEVGKSMLGRTFTTKTNSTSSSSGARSNATDSTQMTDRSLMSGYSAGGFSSTSAGSLARKKEDLRARTNSAFGSRVDYFNGISASRPETPLTGISYHSSHASDAQRSQSQAGWRTQTGDGGGLGGLVAPKPKKSGFFKRMVESAKTGAASARSSIAAGESRPTVPSKSSFSNGISSISGGHRQNQSISTASDMGLGGGGGIDWVQVRRDVNRSNSLSRIERIERKERCQMMDYPAISPVNELYETCDGDEGEDGHPVQEPTNFQLVNLSLVDKNSRFINSLPPMTNPIALATSFVCRPYRSDVQRLRAIFTWVSEKITWEEGFDSQPDSRRVIQTKRGSAEEVAVLVMEMCSAVGIHAEIIRGYLKTPGEVPELTIMPRSNHWWNAVVVDGEWRFLDCSLASPSNPQRSAYSSTNSQQSDPWWFLTRPTELCWTHVPEQHHHQHLCPPIAFEVLLALPCACPQYFKMGLEMVDYDTSLVRIEDLEAVHIRFFVPADIECVAEVEARAFERDVDGDFFESGDTVKKRALAQAEWIGGQKRYTVKGLLPGDEGTGVLKIYAGKRGLMHSIKDVPHPLALALPIIHTGDNPPYEFLTRHPTPHAQRHDLYVVQPQCERLAINNTFVFAIRQHPSSLAAASPNAGGASPIPFIRPTSAMSMTSSSASGSNPSTANGQSTRKPAKLAIQAPGGKVLRLMRKDEKNPSTGGAVEKGDGGTWETIIKVSERGVWRGLVLADRTARWCVFAEWTCV